MGGRKIEKKSEEESEWMVGLLAIGGDAPGLRTGMCDCTTDNE